MVAFIDEDGILCLKTRQSFIREGKQIKLSGSDSDELKRLEVFGKVKFIHEESHINDHSISILCQDGSAYYCSNLEYRPKIYLLSDNCPDNAISMVHFYHSTRANVNYILFLLSDGSLQFRDNNEIIMVDNMPKRVVSISSSYSNWNTIGVFDIIDETGQMWFFLCSPLRVNKRKEDIMKSCSKYIRFSGFSIIISNNGIVHCLPSIDKSNTSVQESFQLDPLFGAVNVVSCGQSLLTLYNDGTIKGISNQKDILRVAPLHPFSLENGGFKPFVLEGKYSQIAHNTLLDENGKVWIFKRYLPNGAIYENIEVTAMFDKVDYEFEACYITDNYGESNKRFTNTKRAN